MEAQGKFMKLRLTDDSVIMATPVHGSDSFSREAWLFIRGTVENRNRIKTESAYMFPEEMVANFDKSVYNEAVTIFIEEGANYLTVDNKDIFDHFGTLDPGPNGDNLDLIAAESSAPGGANAANSSINTGDMHFDGPEGVDQFNGSNLW